MTWLESLLGGALMAAALAPVLYTALGAGAHRSPIALSGSSC